VRLNGSQSGDGDDPKALESWSPSARCLMVDGGNETSAQGIALLQPCMPEDVIGFVVRGGPCRPQRRRILPLDAPKAAGRRWSRVGSKAGRLGAAPGGPSGTTTSTGPMSNPPSVSGF